MGELALALFWPAVVGYAEAAVAYVGAIRFGAGLSRLAIWGVRLGWLAQTALLAAQAVAAGGFAWGSAATSLNLFVWMSVAAYLIWGCRRPYRALGLAVMPLAAVLLAVAWAAGGVDAGTAKGGDHGFLIAHVGLVIAAFAGFTIAAALAALYLWQDRALRRRHASAVRALMPGLATCDRLVARTIAVSTAALTVGVALGLARVHDDGGALDAIAITTLATWVVYVAYLALRWEGGWVGRRSAQVALAGFALVLVIRVGLMPLGHF